ncbi:hypothetical protein REPUB_Repub16aG0122700 [Reevesia pubescens]
MDVNNVKDKQTHAKGKAKRKAETNNENDAARGYISWSLEMDRMLADILRDQRNLGNKNDGGWKSIAYNIAASTLSTQFNVLILGDNVKNRIKLWKKWYGIVTDILGQSGFDWDGTKCMITVDNESAWNEYVKSHKDANCFRFKVIPNWDDIVDLCAKDRATGHGAETAMDASDFMSWDQKNEKNDPEYEADFSSGVQGLDEQNIETQSGASLPTHAQKKRAVTSSTTPFQKKRIADKDELAIAVDFDRQEKLKALKWLTENETQFSVVKNLPQDEKKDYILMFMP